MRILVSVFPCHLGATLASEQSRSQSLRVFWSAPSHGALEESNFQTKILGVPVSRRVRALVYNVDSNFIVSQNANLKKKQDSNTKANKSGEEAQKKPWDLSILGSFHDHFPLGLFLHTAAVPAVRAVVKP